MTGVRAGLRLGVATAAAVLAGCTMLGPDYERPPSTLPASYEPPLQIAPSLGELPASAEVATPSIRADWWVSYGDPVLDRLVERTLATNSDLRQAIARADEAEAALREARAVLVPQIDLGGSATRSRITTAGAQPVPSGVPATRSDYRGALSSDFELDFWGRLRRGAQAIEAQWLASRHALDAVALALSGATAQAWFTLRSLDAQVAVTRESLRAREESLEVVGARANAGLVSDLDVNQAEAAHAEAAVQLEDLLRQRAAIEHQLARLSGEPGQRLPVGDLRGMPVPALPPPGLPSALLDRRPDIGEAEERLIAANASIGVARAAMMPTISLTGAFGAQSRALSQLLEAPARIWSLGIGLRLPIFDSGRLQARAEQVEARQRQALAAYIGVVENAYREVADALTNGSHAMAVERDLDRRVAAARNTVRLAKTRYEAGYSGYLEVLDALRVQHESELSLIRNRQARLAYSVDLMKALGGGWVSASTSDQPASARSAAIDRAARNGERSRSSSR